MSIDPTLAAAHLGLAGALAAQGRRQEAVEGLVAAAEAFSSREAHIDAISLLAQGLTLDPSRVELHLDLAMLEETMGHHDAAVERVEGLAERYMDDGRTDEAAELLRFLSSWGEDAHDELAPRHTVLITGATVIARNPLLFALGAEPQTVATGVPSTQIVLDAIDAIPMAETLESDAEPDPDLVTRVASVRQFIRRPGPPPAPGATSGRLPVEPSPAVVDRLRARAGLRGTHASPRPVSVRTTEPIAIRTTVHARPARDEDVTVRFRRPRQLDAAS